MFDAWQQVAEAPLTTDGKIEIHECTGGSRACFTVEPGDYNGESVVSWPRYVVGGRIGR